MALPSFLKPEEDFPLIIPKAVKDELPKNPFAQPDMAYLSIGEGPFSIDWKAPKMQLPDLREEVLYVGKNGRPDLSNDNEIHISLKGSGDSRRTRTGEKLYLQYRGNYSFTPNNRPSALWIETFTKNAAEKIAVNVGMLDEKGQLINSPQELSQFEIAPKELPRAHSTNWDIGGYRVDSTLLVRQRARWIGEDLFLNAHGGDEFAHTRGKQRIDFLADDSYSCFVKEGDFLIWKNSRWQEVKESQKSCGYPLMVIKKIDEKLMAIEVWDVEGKSKTVLNLIRSKEASLMPNICEEFKFVGAKTWSQFVVESHHERLLIKPQDWLVFYEGEWRKMSTADDIDNYVSQKLTGPLFILDKMIKQEGKQVLVGHIFNGTRTEMMEVQLPAQQTSIAHKPQPLTPTPGMTQREKDNSDGHPLSKLDNQAHQITRGMYRNIQGNIQND